MAVAEALAVGHNRYKVAKTLSRGRKVRRAHWLKQINQWAYFDREFQEIMAQALRGELLLGLGQAVQGLIRQAARGYPPAVKLVFEASGFHNPKMTHDHTGEVVIRLDMPRPVATVDEPIPDADVVEE
jgi:hypothetical protein